MRIHFKHGALCCLPEDAAMCRSPAVGHLAELLTPLLTPSPRHCPYRIGMLMNTTNAIALFLGLQSACRPCCHVPPRSRHVPVVRLPSYHDTSALLRQTDARSSRDGEWPVFCGIMPAVRVFRSGDLLLRSSVPQPLTCQGSRHPSTSVHIRPSLHGHVIM